MRPARDKKPYACHSSEFMCFFFSENTYPQLLTTTREPEEKRAGNCVFEKTSSFNQSWRIIGPSLVSTKILLPVSLHVSVCSRRALLQLTLWLIRSFGAGLTFKSATLNLNSFQAPLQFRGLNF